MAASNQLAIQSALTGIPIDRLIDEALVRNQGVVKYAAADLGISRQALHLRLRQIRKAKASAPQAPGR